MLKFAIALFVAFTQAKDDKDAPEWTQELSEWATEWLEPSMSSWGRQPDWVPNSS